MNRCFYYILILFFIAFLTDCSSSDPTPNRLGGKLIARKNMMDETSESFIYVKDTLTKIEIRTKAGLLLYTHKLIYNIQGKLTTILYEENTFSKHFIDLEYNNQGQLNRMVVDPTLNKSIIYNYGYDSSGKLVNVSFAYKYYYNSKPDNATVYRIEYDNGGNMTRYTQLPENSLPPNPSNAVDFEYDKSFNFFFDLPLPAYLDYSFIIINPIHNVKKEIVSTASSSYTIQYDYTYDTKGRIISSKRYKPDGSPYISYFEYSYED